MNQKKAAEPWFIYLIETAKNSLYCGVTKDLERRFNEHKAQSTKTAKALRGKAPLRLVYAAQLNNKSEALKAEIWIKKRTRLEKLALIDGHKLIPNQHKKIFLQE
ncbi:GIY-YIG nuclease family protein [Agaribacter flavus]|uniref:GIY-YIG nuclease family protein n=1 Tax=Agaribacter flavus TaxID=1902781 RepID=A0ABV7FPT0_9ALTE